jgi:signal transduction histidine kinase
LVLQDEELSPKSRQRLSDFVVAPALRMRQMTEDLRGYLRSIQEDRGPDRQQQVSLEVALDRAIEALNGSIDAASARIIRNGLCVVTGNPLQLEAVFQNLISNACKYRSESRPLLITVSAVKLEDDVHISVRDNGIGFEPAFREDIFKLGRRLHNGESPKWGSGVGLATVRYHVETHGGRVWADSTPGEGTAIHFTIPRHTHEDSSHR